jgi:hypothetical protein
VVEWENPRDIAMYLEKKSGAKQAEAQEVLANEQQQEAELLAAEEIKRLIT